MESCPSNFWSLLGNVSRYWLWCGLGWGPGFGPEVVGYVGAACGLGFSVGITFAGFGFGLPASILIEGPYKAVAVSSKYTWNLVQSSNLLTVKNESGDELGRNIPLFHSQFLSLEQKANQSFAQFKDRYTEERNRDI